MQLIMIIYFGSHAARIRAPEPRQRLESSCFSSNSFGTLVALRTGGPTKRQTTSHAWSTTSAHSGPLKRKLRYASKRDPNTGDAGGNPFVAIADPGSAGDEFTPNRGPAGTDKSDSGAGQKLCRSGRSSPDH